MVEAIKCTKKSLKIKHDLKKKDEKKKLFLKLNVGKEKKES